SSWFPCPHRFVGNEVVREKKQQAKSGYKCPAFPLSGAKQRRSQEERRNDNWGLDEVIKRFRQKEEHESENDKKNQQRDDNDNERDDILMQFRFHGRPDLPE